MLAAAERWGGGADERPFLPRAFSVLRAARRRGCSSCSRTSARAPRGSASCGAGDGLWVLGPLGHGFAPPARRAPRAARAAAGSGTAPLAIWQDELLAAGRPRAGAARLPRRRARRGRGAARQRRASRPTTARVGHHGLVTDLLAAELDARPARDGLRLRPAADARGGPGAVRRARRARPSSRWRPGWPAASARASAASCRRATAATCALCVDGPVLDAAAARETVPGALSRLTTSAASSWPTRSSTARAPSTRSPRGAPSATRCSSDFPFSAFVSKTITLRAARRQPAAAAVGDAGRDDQLDRPAQQGPATATSSTTCPSSRGCPCR